MTTPTPPAPGAGQHGQFPPFTPPAWYQQQGADGTYAGQTPWYPVQQPIGLPTAPPIGCKQCGASPAAPEQVRAHQGLVVMMQTQTADGPWCAVCGIALLRAWTAKTLCQGWWSPLSLVLGAPFALLVNLRAYRQLRRLPPPTAPPGQPQFDPGKPLAERAGAYVAFIPVLWVLWLISSNLPH